LYTDKDNDVVHFQGAGWDAKSMSDYIVKMRIFDSKGELRTYTTENKDMFRAACACFGCFGIIYDVTFKVSFKEYREQLSFISFFFKFR
jgi:FAD/FMN-containing dehydrogenase